MASQVLRNIYGFSLKDELVKNSELKESDLEILRVWSNKQSHLPKISDQYLMLFLHCNNYQMEPTKQTIEQYFTLRTHTPEFFSRRDPIGSKDIRKAHYITPVIPLAKRTPEDYVVLYAYLADTEPSHFNFNDCMTAAFSIVDLLILKYGPVKGYIFVGDCTGVSFGHVGRVSPIGLKKLVYYVQDAIPFRLKGVYFLNAPPVIDIFYNMAKPFMNKDLTNLIHIYSSMDTVSECLPLDIIPQRDHDAKLLEQVTINLLKEMEEMRDWYIEEAAKHRVNEARRMGETKSASNLFGVEGSFKKLDID